MTKLKDLFTFHFRLPGNLYLAFRIGGRGTSPYFMFYIFHYPNSIYSGMKTKFGLIFLKYVRFTLEIG